MRKTVQGGTVFAVSLILFMLVLCFFIGLFGTQGEKKVALHLEYHFLVRSCEETTSAAVAGESYLAGGAGYLYGSEEVVLSCYFRKTDAEAVQSALSDRGVETHIVSRSSPEFRIAAEGKRIEANARTLDTCAHLLYDAANGLERMETGQEEARAAVSGAADALAGLRAGNAGEMFSLWNVALSRAERRAREVASGILFAKDVRYLQVMLCFAVVDCRDYFA